MRNRTISRCFEPIDDFLEGLNLSRKQIPRDASSLFRAVAEKIFLTQRFHEEVREMCLDYMASHKENFIKLIPQSVTAESHILKMRSPLEWPKEAEIHALAELFHIEFTFFYEDCLQLSESTTLIESVSKNVIILYRDNSNHFDLVIPRNTTSIAGFCQALVYQMLYTNVFKVENVMSIVDKMLHDSSSSFRKDSTNSNDAQDIIRIVEHVTDPTKAEDSLLNISMEYTSSPVREITPPFPYRVAKALDPDLYRNSDFDIYTAKRKEIRYGPYDSKGLQIGVKVIVKTSFLSKEDKGQYNESERKFVKDEISKENVLHGHIQAMSDNHGPVQVYVEEFAKKIFVPYDSLEKCCLTPSRLVNESTHWIGSPYRMMTSIRRPALPIPDICNSPTYSKKKKKFAFPTPLRIQPKRKSETQQKVSEVCLDSHQVRTQEVGGSDSYFIPPVTKYPSDSVTSSFEYPGYYMVNNLPMPSIGTSPELELISKQFEMAMNFNGQYYPSYTYYPMPAEACNASVYGLNYNYPVLYGTPPGPHPVQCYPYYPTATEMTATPHVNMSTDAAQECCSFISYSGYGMPASFQQSNDKHVAQFEGQPLVKVSHGDS